MQSILQDKCSHYWPLDTEPMFYGDLQVKIVGEVHDAQQEYNITYLELSQVRFYVDLRTFHNFKAKVILNLII